MEITSEKDVSTLRRKIEFYLTDEDLIKLIYDKEIVTRLVDGYRIVIYKQY